MKTCFIFLRRKKHYNQLTDILYLKEISTKYYGLLHYVRHSWCIPNRKNVNFSCKICCSEKPVKISEHELAVRVTEKVLFPVIYNSNCARKCFLRSSHYCWKNIQHKQFWRHIEYSSLIVTSNILHCCAWLTWILYAIENLDF